MKSPRRILAALAPLLLAANLHALAPSPAPAADTYDPTKPAAARPPAAKREPRPEPVSAARAFLWEVKSPTAKVYLFGTIHVGKRSFYPLPLQVENAFTDADKLVVEADVSGASSPAEVESIIAYRPPDSLDKHVPPALYTRLKAQLARLNIPEPAVKQMKPFIVGGLLSIAEFSRLGYDMNRGVDAYLLARAKEERKPVQELETATSQLKMLDSLPPDLQEAFLDNAVMTLESGRTADQVTGIVNAWQLGDPRLMQEVNAGVNKGMRFTQRLDEALLFSRHDHMLKKIEGFLAGHENCFVAVGSLHLIGPRGLLEALKAKGYEINQK